MLRKRSGETNNCLFYRMGVSIERSPRTFSKPMYGTRPCCLVQAITRHACLDPHLGSWNCLPHQAHIAPNDANEQHRLAGFESRLVPDLPLPFIPTLIGLRAFDLVSSPVWWEAATNKQSVHWAPGGMFTTVQKIVIYKRVVARKIRLTRRFSLFRLLN